MIHVCFCFHDKTGHYCKFTGTTMLSLFENTYSEVTVHILHDNTLTPDNRDKFIYLAGRYGQLVKFYNVEKLCADKLAEFMKLFPAMQTSRVTSAGFFKFLIPDVLSNEISKCIYLDSDLIINIDIKELWKINLANKPVAAANEIELVGAPWIIPKRYLVKNEYVAYEDYFNSGVIVMDLNSLRQSEKLIMEGIRFRGEHPCDFFDQDIWNYLFSKNYLKLSRKFNFFVDQARKTSQICPAIYHYVSITLKLDMNDAFNQLWLNHLVKTPWFDADIVCNIYKSIVELETIHLGRMREFSSLMSGKIRTFVVNKGNLDRVKEDFFIRDDEEIIITEENELHQDLIDKMKNLREENIFFVAVPNIYKELKDAGLVENKDFFNAFLFYV